MRSALAGISGEESSGSNQTIRCDACPTSPVAPPASQAPSMWVQLDQLVDKAAGNDPMALVTLQEAVALKERFGVRRTVPTDAQRTGLPWTAVGRLDVIPNRLHCPTSVS